MKLNALCKRAFNNIITNDGDYSWDGYIPFDKAIRQELSTVQGVYTDLYIKPDIPTDNGIRLAVILSDFTSVFIPPHPSTFQILIPNDQEKAINLSNDRLPLKFFQSSMPIAQQQDASPNYQARKMFGIPLIGGLTELIDDLGCFMESGRLLVRPTPQIEIGVAGREDLQPVYLCAEPNSPGEDWIVQNEEPQCSLPLRTGIAGEFEEDTIANILLPYIRDIPFGLLSQILEDEHDYLSEMRMSMKGLIKLAPVGRDKSLEYYNDSLKPAIDRVSRRFKVITNMHAIKITGSVMATAAVSLASLQHSGIVASICSLLSAAGLVGISKEVVDYYKAKTEAKEMPFYLLWRISRESRK